ncbi:restriction endonuclease subunit S [Nostoc sp. UHCC 0252]|uniref:restriction endonuclease subunit S n=1 Tax=Nostoc sp. UHCC 0252 TaxID=3110241 RepID=UPI002B20DAAC|nr:restriction endonuclease subunit S [Nostoc sp. UHCC 0252]MEA5603604.1 restriction endonuclease subunit S [Nostoc sp. UHCC 0252]
MQGWKLKTLGEIAEVQSGGTPLKSRNEYWFGDIPWYSSGELNDTFTKASKELITPKGLEESNAKLFPKGSLLIGMYDTAALKMSILDRDAAFNQAIAGVKPNENIDLKFILFAINSRRFEILNQRRGVRQKNLSLAKIKNIALPIPSLLEQKRIVAILDETFEGIDRAIANTKKNLANSRELFESYLNAIFTEKGDGWVEKKLGDVCDFLNGFAFKSTDTVNTSNIQLIRMGNLYQNILDLERNPVFYPNGFREIYAKYVLSSGDLIMSLTGTVDKEDYGYTVEVPKTEKILLLNQRIAKFINIDTSYVDKKFFLHLLRSKSFLNALYNSSRGVRQANLSSLSMKKIPISLPPVEIQKLLVSDFRALQAETQCLETIYRQKITALNELKQSILQKAFTGELTADTANQTTKAAQEVNAA